MKYTLSLGLMLAAFSTSAMATEMAKPEPGKGDMMGAHMGMRGGMDKHMDYMFKEMDTNSDGVISSEESAAFGKKKFDEHYTNHDGKVTKEEWDAYGAAKHKEMMEKMEKMKGDMPMGDKAPAEPKK